MKDIDFDELDRAVSSLMGSVPKDAPAKTTDESMTEPEEDTAQIVVDEHPQADEPSPEDSITTPAADTADDELPPVSLPESIEDSKPEPEQSPARPAAAPPSRGRFMDVVRPSREMRKSSFPVSRQGVTLQPSAPKPSMESTTPPKEEQPSPNTTSTNMIVPEDHEDTAAVASIQEAATTGSSSFTDTDESAPLSSPFLPDAKVEKRPLGRQSEALSEDAEDELSESSDETVRPFPVMETPSPEADAQLPEEPVPAEFDSKLLSIETDTTIQQVEAQAIPPTPEIVTSPVTEETEKSSPAIDVPRAMAAASIPQQYKLENVKNDELPASAIYDTQPLAHPATSKPGWLLPAAIIGILVLGAALGAGVYYLGLI